MTRTVPATNAKVNSRASYFLLANRSGSRGRARHRRLPDQALKRTHTMRRGRRPRAARAARGASNAREFLNRDTRPVGFATVSYATLRYDVSDAGVATIALDQPDTRNALSDELLGELIAALEAARDDGAVRCVVLTSTHDRVFSAGGG